MANIAIVKKKQFSFNPLRTEQCAVKIKGMLQMHLDSEIDIKNWEQTLIKISMIFI